MTAAGWSRSSPRPRPTRWRPRTASHSSNDQAASPISACSSTLAGRDFRSPPPGGYRTTTVPLDSVAELDQRSLQHLGSYALALTRHFGSVSLEQTKAPDSGVLQRLPVPHPLPAGLVGPAWPGSHLLLGRGGDRARPAPGSVAAGWAGAGIRPSAGGHGRRGAGRPSGLDADPRPPPRRRLGAGIPARDHLDWAGQPDRRRHRRPLRSGTAPDRSLRPGRRRPAVVATAGGGDQCRFSAGQLSVHLAAGVQPARPRDPVRPRRAGQSGLGGGSRCS